MSDRPAPAWILACELTALAVYVMLLASVTYAELTGSRALGSLF